MRFKLSAFKYHSALVTLVYWKVEKKMCEIILAQMEWVGDKLVSYNLMTYNLTPYNLTPSHLTTKQFKLTTI